MDNKYENMQYVFDFFEKKYKNTRNDDDKREIRNRMDSLQHQMFIAEGESQE